jgi:hypothetical protein
MSQQQIQLYTSQDGQVTLEVTQDAETLWLSQAQIAELFGVKPQNITMHLKNVFEEGELEEAATCKESLQVQQEGARQVKRQRKRYNLDAIISVGYRVNSSRATQFRIWASNVLKQHLALNQVLDAIAQLKQNLIHKGEASELFGQLRGDGLETAMATIEQGFVEHFILLKNPN